MPEPQAIVRVSNNNVLLVHLQLHTANGFPAAIQIKVVEFTFIKCYSSKNDQKTWLFQICIRSKRMKNP